MKQKKNTPNNKYGNVYLTILTNKELTTTARAIYALLAVKQGNANTAHLTQKQIADSLTVTERTVRRAFSELQKAGIIEPANKPGGSWSVKQPELTNQYGKVEQIVLGSNLISVDAKLLYAYYVVVTGGVETCTRSANTIKQDLKIGNDKYHAAFNELQESTLITVNKKNIPNGYVNLVVPRRLKKANPKEYLPASWFNEELNVIPDNLPEISMADVAAKSRKKQDKFSSPHRTKQVVRTGQIGETNINHNINHNKELVLDDVTAVTKFTGDKINLKIFHSKFDTTKLEDSNAELIIQLFTTIRTATQNYNWRMSNEDFIELWSMVLDYLPDKEAIEDYEWFITDELIPSGRKGNSLAYYLSDGIKTAYTGYHNARVSGANFNLDDRTTRKNYQLEYS